MEKKILGKERKKKKTKTTKQTFPPRTKEEKKEKMKRKFRKTPHVNKNKNMYGNLFNAISRPLVYGMPTRYFGVGGNCGVNGTCSGGGGGGRGTRKQRRSGGGNGRFLRSRKMFGG